MPPSRLSAGLLGCLWGLCVLRWPRHAPGVDPSSSRGPGVLNRVAAFRRREVSSFELEAFRRAGSSVFELSLAADARRESLLAEGVHPFDADPSSASLFLCAWNASVFQALACELLDADVREDPASRGFVPPSVFADASALFAPVSFWLASGRRAGVSAEFWVGDVAELPAALPEFVSAQGPRKSVRGLLTAGDVLHGLLEEALGAVAAAGPVPPRWVSEFDRVSELAAQAHSSLRYAQGLWHPASSPSLDASIAAHVVPALVLEHHLGQFLALPELLGRYRDPSAPLTSAGRPGVPAPSRVLS